MTPPTRRLIVNADDFGLHAQIDEGIVRGHRDGIVTSASICPNGRSFESAARSAREAGLDVGVHLALVGEAPVSPPDTLPTLAPAGRLPASYHALFRRLLFGRIRRAEIERELEAQVARVRDAGLAVSHLNSHQHVHLHPQVLPYALRLAGRFGVRAIRAGRRVWPLRGLRPAVMALFVARAARLAQRDGLGVADTVVGLAETGGLGEERLLRVLDRLMPGTSELVCHPGVHDSEIDAAYGWHFHWDEELRALTSPRVRAKLQQDGIHLAAWRDL